MRVGTARTEISLQADTKNPKKKPKRKRAVWDLFFPSKRTGEKETDGKEDGPESD